MPPEPIMTSPMPLRVRVVSNDAALPLRHPSPGGAASQTTISRLERSAEDMSQGGSDIAEEIRKMSQSSRSGSLYNSQDHDDDDDDDRDLTINPWRIGSGRSRNGHARGGGYSPGGYVTSPAITSPTNTSVYSHGSRSQAPPARIPSSARSSTVLAPMVEPVLEGRPLDSPLAPSSTSVPAHDQQISRQALEPSFSAHVNAMALQFEESLHIFPPTPSSHRATNQLPTHHEVDLPDRPPSTDTFQEAQIAFQDFDGVHFDPDREEFVEVDDDGREVRRVSARSSSGTLMDAASLLRTSRQQRPVSYAAPPPSNGMVYYPAPVPRMLNLPKRLSQQPPAHVQAKRRSQMLNDLPAGARESAPWIPPMTFSEDGRASQAGDVRSHRSGSGSTNQQNEYSRGMLNERMSVANAHNLPPQLRASVFFEHQSVPHDVEVKSESAVATLESILAASATAPVSAFTDHPYAGDVRKTVYASARTHQRQGTATSFATAGEMNQDKRVKKRRSSSLGNLLRRKSTDLLVGQADEGKQSRPASSGSMLDLNDGGDRLRKRASRLSLGGDLDRASDSTHRTGGGTMPERERRQTGLGLGMGLIDQATDATFKAEGDTSGSRPLTKPSKPLTEGDVIEQDFRDEAAQEDFDIEDDDPVFAQPTTLLAELQVRKAQLKSRSRTAATAYPGGMHSTLLQLDAVEQINAKRRQKQRVALAWEDPQLRAEEEAQRDGVDEDVPLGVLYPSKDGLMNRKLGDSRDWSRPLGLMDRRELEDREPLSNRRNRLNPGAPSLTAGPSMSQLHLAGQPDMTSEKQDDEDEGETLGQRLRRLKTKEALDNAIGDVGSHLGHKRDFSATVLDEFPELNTDEDKDKGKPGSSDMKDQLAAAGIEGEETLGQRRARLQRERAASGDAPDAVRPALHTSQSAANLLSSNTVGQRGAMGKTHQAARGTLLHAADQRQLKSRQDIMATNLRSSSYGFSKPLGNSRLPANGAYVGNAATTTDPLMGIRAKINSGLLGAHQSRPRVGGFAGGVYNTTAGSASAAALQFSSTTPMFGHNNNNPYFASPTANMAYGAYGTSNIPASYQMHPQQQQQQQQPMLNPSTYYALHGGSTHPTVQPPTQSMYHPMAGLPAGGAGTYAYGAQQQMAGLGMMGFDQASLDPNQRAAIDQWRLGVAK